MVDYAGMKKSAAAVLALIFILSCPVFTAVKTTVKRPVKPRVTAPAKKTAPKKPAEWAAKVNGDVISMEWYNRALNTSLKQINREISTEATGEEEQVVKDAKRRILEQIIEAVIFMQWAEREGIEVKDTEIKARIQKIKKGFPTPQEFHKSLADQGISPPDLERDVKKQIITDRLIAAREKKLAVSDEEMQAFYDKNIELYQPVSRIRLKQVFAKDRNDINKIKKYLSGGGKFIGEDIGLVEPGQLPVEDSSLFKLKVGEISEIITGEAGFYIFRMEEKISAKQTTFDDVKDNIRRFLLSEKARTQYLDDLKEEKKNAKITVTPKLQYLFEEIISPEGAQLPSASS